MIYKQELLLGGERPAITIGCECTWFERWKAVRQLIRWWRLW